MKLVRSVGLLGSWILAGWFVASSAIAATIIVSGDSSIGSALDGSRGAPVNENNATWFTNILGSGTSVIVQSGAEDAVGASADSINTYYNSLPGVTSTRVAADSIVDDTFLEDVDLYISMVPSDDYTSAELGELSSFLSGGGAVFFTGEHASWSAYNARINSALEFLGSEIRIMDDTLDRGWKTTSNIESDPFNEGVASFTYGSISVTSGGIPLVGSLDGTPFIAYVPLPAAALLFGSGLMVLFGMAARRRKAVVFK